MYNKIPVNNRVRCVSQK